MTVEPAPGPPGSSPERFEQIIQVEAPDIDELGHVNNIVYVRWVQEVATAHWPTLSRRAPWCTGR